MSEQLICQGLSALHTLDDYIEVRAKTKDGFVRRFGSRGDLAKLARRIQLMDEIYEAIWATLNPLNPTDFTNPARDIDVAYRRWLPLDFDPVGERPADYRQLANAETTAAVCLDFLCNKGWPKPLVACGGNSAHLLYRTEPLATFNDLIPRALNVLSKFFTNDTVVLDPANSNASRVWKVYGTMSRKGVASDDRPYRRASISEYGGTFSVTVEQLRDLIRYFEGANVDFSGPHETPEYKNLPADEFMRRFDEVQEFVEAYCERVRGPRTYRGNHGNTGMKWEFDCPWQVDGHALDRWKAYLVLYHDGSIVAGCQGGRCRSAGHGYMDLQDALMERAGYGQE